MAPSGGPQAQAENGQQPAANGFAVDGSIADTFAEQIAQKKLHPSSVLRCLLLVARPERWLLYVAALWLFASSYCKLAIPNSTAQMIAAVVRASHGREAIASTEFRAHVRRFITASTGVSIFAALRIWCSAKAEVAMIARLRRLLYSSLLQQDISTFDIEGPGHVASRLNSDVALVGSVLSSKVNLVLQSGSAFLGSLFNLWRLSPRLALMYLGFSVLFGQFAERFGGRQRAVQAHIQYGEAKMSGVASEALSLIRVVRSSGTEPYERGKYYDLCAPVVKNMMRNKMGWALFSALSSGIQNAITVLILIFGSRAVAHGRMTGTDFAAFMLYCGDVQASMFEIAGHIPAVMTGLGAGERVFELMALVPTIPTSGGIVPSLDSKDESSSGELVVQDVHFAYPLARKLGTAEVQVKPEEIQKPGEEVLRGMSLKVSRGEMVALVGLSGAGKTSLVNLILRFYEVSSGSIMLGGHDLRELDPNYLHSKVAVVSQEPALFAMSVHDNIAYGRPGTPREEVERAAALCNASGFISKLPQGFDTVVGERGATLSGGQRQRIAIARALLRQPRLLILDEATSALDALNESAVLGAVSSIHRSADMAMLVIAHRLSTVKDATRIVVMDGGRVVEEGAHGELLKLGGVYSELVARQLQSSEGGGGA